MVVTITKPRIRLRTRAPQGGACPVAKQHCVELVGMNRRTMWCSDEAMALRLAFSGCAFNYRMSGGRFA
jgi:hypothetical protein